MKPGDLVATLGTTDMRPISFRDGDPGPVATWNTFSDPRCVGLVLETAVVPDICYPDGARRIECRVLTPRGTGWVWIHQLEVVQ